VVQPNNKTANGSEDDRNPDKTFYVDGQYVTDIGCVFNSIAGKQALLARYQDTNNKDDAKIAQNIKEQMRTTWQLITNDMDMIEEWFNAKRIAYEEVGPCGAWAKASFQNDAELFTTYGTIYDRQLADGIANGFPQSVLPCAKAKLKARDGRKKDTTKQGGSPSASATNTQPQQRAKPKSVQKNTDEQEVIDLMNSSSSDSDELSQ
jgi:hypothetical protein